MENYEESLQRLSKQVGDLTSSNIIKKSSFFKNIKVPFYTYYMAVPLVITLIFVLWKPTFITVKTLNTNGLERKVSFQKTFLTVIMITFLIFLSIYGYNYKSGNKITY